MKHYIIKYSLNGLENIFGTDALNDEEALAAFKVAYGGQGVILSYDIADIPVAETAVSKFSLLSVEDAQTAFDNVTAVRRELASLHEILGKILITKKELLESGDHSDLDGIE